MANQTETEMCCKACKSENVRHFRSEIATHSPGVGWPEETPPEGELKVLQEAKDVKAAAV